MGPDKTSDELASRRLPLVVAAEYGSAGGWTYSPGSLSILCEAINHARLAGTAQILVECKFQYVNNQRDAGICSDALEKFKSATKDILDALTRGNEKFEALELKVISAKDDLFMFTITHSK